MVSEDTRVIVTLLQRRTRIRVDRGRAHDSNLVTENKTHGSYLSYFLPSTGQGCKVVGIEVVFVRFDL